MKFDTIHEEINDRFYLWIGHSHRCEEYPFIVSVFTRHRDGIKSYLKRLQTIKPHNYPDLEITCRLEGYLSKRPYLPGQACDGTIDGPVIALFHSFCTQHRLDSLLIYNRTHPDNILTSSQWKQHIEFGHWQGVYIPTWNQTNYSLLINSLQNANYSSLINYLLDLEMYPSPFFTGSPRQEL